MIIVRHMLMLVGWTLLMLVVVGALLFLFAFGYCGDDAACLAWTNRNTFIIMGGGFILYGAGVVMTVRRMIRAMRTPRHEGC